MRANSIQFPTSYKLARTGRPQLRFNYFWHGTPMPPVIATKHTPIVVLLAYKLHKRDGNKVIVKTQFLVREQTSFA